MTELQAQESNHVTPPRDSLGFLGLMGMAVGIVACVFRALVWAHGFLGGELVGYAIAGMMTSFLIAYAIAGRRKIRNLKKFGLWFGAISIILLLLEVENSRPFFGRNAKPASQLLTRTLPRESKFGFNRKRNYVLRDVDGKNGTGKTGQPDLPQFLLMLSNDYDNQCLMGRS